MIRQVRTTVNIDDELLAQAKVAAAAARRSLGDLVDDGLRLLLARRDPAPAAAVDLPTDGGGGLRAGVDLEDKARLRELLGDDGLDAAS